MGSWGNLRIVGLNGKSTGDLVFWSFKQKARDRHCQLSSLPTAATLCSQHGQWQLQQLQPPQLPGRSWRLFPQIITVLITQLEPYQGTYEASQWVISTVNLQVPVFCSRLEQRSRPSKNAASTPDGDGRGRADTPT